MSTASSRIDYVGLIFRNDAVWFQDHVVPFIEDSKAKAFLIYERPGSIKYRVGKARSGSGSTYQVDAWGWCADVLAMDMPTAWWSRLTRLDFRQEIEDWSKDELHTFATEVHRRGIAGFNTAPLNKRDAAKTDRRGVGGAGLQIGAWSANRSLTIYKRRTERAACEIRLNSKMARPLGQNVVDLCVVNPSLSPYLEACVNGRVAWKNMLMRVFGTWEVDAVIQENINAVENVRELVAAADAERTAKLARKQDYWSRLAEDLPDVSDAFSLTSPGDPS